MVANVKLGGMVRREMKENEMEKTQSQMFYDAQRKTADLDHAFLEMVKDGMTAKELEALIEKRPHVYSRFSHWIAKLP